MGFFDFGDGASVISGKSSHRRSKRSSRHKSRSPDRGRSFTDDLAASFFGGDNYNKHNSSRSSFFGMPNASRSSFFGFNRGSYYKRSPRHGFLYKARKQVKRLWRDLLRLMKDNPIKVVTFVLVPLITSGLLTGLLAKFGLRLPAGVEKWLGIGAKAAGGDSSGLMGEAVKMASRSFAEGGSPGGVRSQFFQSTRGPDADIAYGRTEVEQDLPWGDAFTSMAKMFGK